MSLLWPRSRSRRFSLRLVALTTVIGLVAGTSASAGDARGGGAIAKSAKRDCASDLARANSYLRHVLALRADARKGKFFLVPAAEPVKFYPIHIEAYTDMLILELFAGNITRSDLKYRIKLLSRYRAATMKTLNGLVKDLVRERNELAEKCADQAKPKPPAPPPPPPADGAFPGGTATTLTLTIGGTTVTTDLKSNKQDTDPTIKASSPTALSGTVALNGTLPPGWSVVVFHNGSSDIRFNSATGGTFSLQAIFPTFDANTRPGAYICSTPAPPLCTPAAQASITIDSDP